MPESHESEERLAELRDRITTLKKINRALMNRVERSVDTTGNAYAVFESNILLQNTIQDRTRELADANEQLRREIIERRFAEKTLQESQRRMADIINFLPDATFVIDRDGVVITWNHAMEELSGVPATEMLGKGDYEYSFPFYGVRRPILIDLVLMPVETIEEKYPSVRHDGDTLIIESHIPTFRDGSWLWAKASPLYDDQGRLIGAIESIRDVTEKRLAEEHHQQLKEKLDRAERMESLGVLAGGVAHDLNNMLGPLVGYPELILLQLPEDSPMRHRIQRIGDAATKAAEVIQDLLTLARRGRYEMIPLSLNDIIGEYLDSPNFVTQCEANPDVRVDLALADDISSVKGSSPHLSKMIMNLVVNAFDAMPDGGALTISTQQQYLDKLKSGHDRIERGDYVILHISDTGLGIEERDINKIFEPYYSNKKMGRSGSGLGLSVVYGIIKDHKGYYDIFSSPGEGTDFVIYLQVCKVQMQAKEISVRDLNGTETILVVDDVPEQLEISKALLESFGYTAHTCENGRLAVAWLREHTADLVMLDMIMEPDYDGLDTYRDIIAIRPDQKAVIVSGFSATDRVNQMQKLGAGAYIKKPFSRANLGAAIREELDRTLVVAV